MKRVAVAILRILAVSLPFLIPACTESGAPTPPTAPSSPSLVSLSLLQASVAGEDSASAPYALPCSPADSGPGSRRFEINMVAGRLAILPGIPARASLSVTYRGVAVPESLRADGAPIFLIEVASEGDVEMVLADSSSGERSTYALSLFLKTIGDPGSFPLDFLALRQVLFDRHSYPYPIELSPPFHPDSLAYTATIPYSMPTRLLAVPSDPASEVTVVYDGSALQPEARMGDTVAYARVGPEFEGRFTATVRQPANGRSRTYSITVSIAGAWSSGEWVPLPRPPIGIRALDFVDGRTGFAGDEHFSIYRTADSGMSWTKVALPPEEIGFNTFEFVTADTGYLASLAGHLLKTTDGGGHWEALPAMPPVAQLSFRNSRVGYANTLGAILRTRDGGRTWEEILAGLSYMRMDFVSPSLGYVCGPEGKVLKTRDGGDTWEDVSLYPDRSQYLSYVHAVDSNTVYVRDTATFMTGDGGRTWEYPASPFGGRFADLVFTDSMTGYIAIVEGGVHSIQKTEDGGATWRLQYRNPAGFDILCFPAPGIGYAASASRGLLRLVR